MGEPNEHTTTVPPVISNVLCYISTARHNMRHDDIVRICLAFYSDDVIIKGKDLLYELVGEKPKRRRHENRMLNEMQDILDMLKKCDDLDTVLPKFVADSYCGLPPSSGFEVVAQSLTTLISEINTLKNEIESLRENRLAETVFHHDTVLIKEDLLTIKGEIRKLNHKMIDKEIRRNSLNLDVLYNSDHNVRDMITHIRDQEDNLLSPSAPPASQEPWNFYSRSFQDNGGPPSAPDLSKLMSATGVALDRDETTLSTAIQSPSAPSLPHGIPTSTQEMRSPPRDRSLDEDKPSEESNENGADNNDGFQTVRKKRKKNNNIVGSKKMPGNLTIRSAMRTADIYVGNCDLDVTVESLS